MLCGKKQVTSFCSKGEKGNLLRESSNTCNRVIVLTQFKVTSQEKYKVFLLYNRFKVTRRLELKKISLSLQSFKLCFCYQLNWRNLPLFCHSGTTTGPPVSCLHVGSFYVHLAIVGRKTSKLCNMI